MIASHPENVTIYGVLKMHLQSNMSENHWSRCIISVHLNSTLTCRYIFYSFVVLLRKDSIHFTMKCHLEIC
jgi:hypothetical protein